MMPHFKDVPRPEFHSGETTSIRMRSWLLWASEKDPLGHKVHLTLGVAALVLIPLSSTLASIGSTLVIGYAILRCHVLYQAWKEMFLNPCVLVLFGLYVWLAISITWSLDPDHGIRLIRGSRYLLLIPALAPLLLNLRTLLFGPCIALAIVLPCQLYGYMTGNSALLQGGLSEHPGFLGIWMTVSSAALVFATKSNPIGLWGNRLAPLSMCAITFSAARSVLLAAGTSLIAGLLLVAFYNQKFRKRITWTVIAMLATGAVMTFFFDSEMSRRLSQYIESPNAKNAAQSDFPIDGARPLWWRVGIDNYLQNPIVGSGMGSAEPLIHGDKEVDDVTSAGSRNQFVLRDDFHSSYITALSETGSIGGLLFAGWILLVFAKTFSRAEASPILLATLVAYLIFAIFNTTFYSGRLVAITAYLTVLALSVCPQLESKNE